MAISYTKQTRAIDQRAARRSTLLKTAGLLGLAAPLAWIGYSSLAIDHQLPLPEALDAPRATISGPEFGKLSYYAQRRASGRPLVLIHSINAGGSAYEMKPLFDLFSKERPVFAPDLPGFGFSERSDRKYTPELYTAAILTLLDSIERVEGGVDVVALSLSSEFAARAAQRRPELFHSLTLISPTGFSTPKQLSQCEQADRRQLSERVHQAAAFPLWGQALYDLLATKPSIGYFLQQLFVGPVDAGLLNYDYATTHQPGARYAPLYFISGTLFTPNIREEVYATLDLPVLVLYDRDPFVRFDALPDFRQQHPQWQSVRITPTNGMPQFEQPAECAEVMTSFYATMRDEYQLFTETDDLLSYSLPMG